MSYAIKYRLPFKSINGKNCQVYIDELNFSGTTTTIKGVGSPIIIDYPSVEVFEPIFTSGANLNLLSETDRQFVCLYNDDDPLKYRVRLLVDGEVIWLGFLNTSQYDENFSENNNYPVTFTANDGFTILSKLSYLTPTGEKYEGRDSLFQMIINSIDKLNKSSYYYYYISLPDIQAYETPYNGENILTECFLYYDNWYDEDEQPFNCREVIEEILRPLGISITLIGKDYFIFNETISTTGTTIFQKFDSNGDYIKNVELSMFDDVNNLGVYDNVSSFGFINKTESLKLDYNTYINNTAADIEINDTYIDQLIDSRDFYYYVNYSWIQETYSTSTTSKIEKINNGNTTVLAKGIPTGQSVRGENELHYLLLDNTFGDWSDMTPHFRVKKNPYFVGVQPLNNQYELKIECEAYFRNSVMWGKSISDYNNKRCKIGQIRLLIKNGNQYLTDKPPFYSMTPANYVLYFYNKDAEAHIANQWIKNQFPLTDFEQENIPTVNVDVTIPFQNISSTVPLEVYILGNPRIYDNDGDNHNNILQDARIRSLKMTIIKNGKEVKNSEECIIKNERKWATDTKTITTKIGSNYVADIDDWWEPKVEHPGLISSITNQNNYRIYSIWYNGESEFIENARLKREFNQISKTRNNYQVNVNYSPNYTPLKMITNTNLLPGKKFMQTSKTIDVYNEKIMLELTEII